MRQRLLVSIIRCIIVGVHFRCDIIITFRDATVDGVELFVVHWPSKHVADPPTFSSSAVR